MKDSESDLLQKIDMLTRENADLQDKVRKFSVLKFGGIFENELEEVSNQI